MSIRRLMKASVCGAINALRQLNLCVGREVGIVSYDNNGFLEFLDHEEED